MYIYKIGLISIGWLLTCSSRYICIYICAHIYIHIHIHTYTYIYIAVSTLKAALVVKHQLAI